MSSPRVKSKNPFGSANPFADDYQPDSRQPDESLLYVGAQGRSTPRYTVVVDQPIIQPTQPWNLNVVQKASGWAFRYTMAQATTLYYGLEMFPPAPEPFGTMVGFIAINVNDLTGLMFGRLLGKESPLAYLRAAGNGHAGKGFLKEGGRFVAALVPPAAVGVGTGYALMKYGPELAQATHPALVVLNVMATTPMISGPIFGLVSFGIHQGTLALTRLCMKAPELIEGKQHLHPAQRIVEYMMRPMAAVTLFEVIRLALKAGNVETMVHDKYFPIMVIACQQFLTQAWPYLSFVPRPIENLVPRTTVEVEDVETGKMLKPLEPAQTYAETHALSFYLIRTAFVFTAGLLLLRMGMRYWSEDRENLSNSEAMGYLSVLALGGQIAETLFQQAPRLVSLTKQGIAKCSSTLFAREAKASNDEDAPFLDASANRSAKIII